MTARSLLLSALFSILGCTERALPEEPVLAPYGASCADNSDCESGMCLGAAESFCTRECFDDCGCPAGAGCTVVSDSLSVCAPGANTCSPVADAGTPDGEMPPPADTGIAMSGGGAGAPCTTSADCDEVRSGGGTGPRPEYTMEPQECFPSSRGFPGGFCSMTDCVTNFRRDPCPTGTECFNLTIGSVCLVECEGPSDCRDGWVCRPDIDPSGPLCFLSCATTGCQDGLSCRPDGTCAAPVVTPVDYDVTMRSASLGGSLTDVDGMATGGDNLTIRLPFDVPFFSETYSSGTTAVASWQGLFAFDRSGVMAFVPGDHTRYEPAAPLIVAHHFANTSSSGGSIAYRVTGAAPNRSLEVEWNTENLSGSGGARFRLRFTEGSDIFVIHYGAMADDVFAESWTQLAMLDATQYEEVIVSRGSPTPSSSANTEFTYTPR